MNNARYTPFRYLTAIVLAIAGIISIIASGGGGGSSFSPTSAQGLWIGTTASTKTISGIVLDDGTYWFISSRPGNPAAFGGFIQGSGSSSGSDFSSSNARDFNADGFFNDASFAGSFSAGATFDGTFTYDVFTDVINTDYDVAYDLTPSLGAIAGTYVGTSINLPEGGNPRSADIVIGSDGTMTVAGIQNCNNFQGTVMPHAAGNVYDVSGTILNVGCVPGGSRDVNGIAFFDIPTQTLYVTAVNSDRSFGYFLTGVRQ